MAEVTNQTILNNSSQILSRFDGSEDLTNNTEITIIFSGILVVFIIVVILVVHRVIKVKEATDIMNRNKSKQFIGAIYKRNSASSKVSSMMASPPTTPVMAFDNPTFASSPKKTKRMESIGEGDFECELIDMDEIDLDDVLREDEVDIVMADIDEEETNEEIPGHRRSVSWS